MPVTMACLPWPDWGWWGSRFCGRLCEQVYAWVSCRRGRGSGNAGVACLIISTFYFVYMKFLIIGRLVSRQRGGRIPIGILIVTQTGI